MRGVEAWTFLGTFWLVVVVVVFPAELVLQPNAPGLIVLAHGAFVGMMTNLLFGVFSVRTRESRDLYSWADKLGLVIFFGLLIAWISITAR